MNDHDPLCPSLHEIPNEDPLGCWCYLITKARADERKALRAEGWWTSDAHVTAMNAMEDWARADERERIAAAIENESDAIPLDAAPWDVAAREGMERAAIIARNSLRAGTADE